MSVRGLPLVPPGARHECASWGTGGDVRGHYLIHERRAHVYILADIAMVLGGAGLYALERAVQQRSWSGVIVVLQIAAILFCGFYITAGFLPMC